MERREASAVSAGVRWAAALTVVGVALAGCGASRTAQTSEMAPAVSGVNVDAGALALRDLQVDFGQQGFYPEGGQAPLRVWIDNLGDEPVVLEAVTSSAAESVILVTEMVVPGETPGADEPTPTADESTTPETDASPTADATESPGADASPTADAATSKPAEGEGPVAELEGTRDFEIEIAPGSYVRLAPTTGSFLVLDGLQEDLAMGATVELTFVFSNGEAVTVDLPMGVPEEAPSRSYFEPRHEEGAE
ncbi:copper chaperone PCu(A)C [Glycomyces sp. YM15]|uniref:copper chaperone PCu(A)C n=1 Tax=Glycomyces sp. YM15 TaxID=2800446 RepID=UPI001964A41D|nr:copper chaperone PCu(A)C [Glycomyces sp. YM15]